MLVKLSTVFLASMVMGSLSFAMAANVGNTYRVNAGNADGVTIPAFSTGEAVQEGIEEEESPDDAEPVVGLEQVNGVYVRTVDGEPSPLPSCLSYLQNGLGQGQNGVYQLSISHARGSDYYCDMVTDGGGWSLVVAQFESSSHWWSGSTVNYDPTLGNGVGFALGTLPAHSQMGLGQTASRGVTPEFIFNYNYSTANIPLSTITDQYGRNYHIHRNEKGYYGAHDPERNDYRSPTNETWRNTLTVDYMNETAADGLFIFAPIREADYQKGFAYKGNLAASNDAGAWLVFVR
jgi:hypothetical protein